MPKFFAIISALFLVSCSANIESPVIYFSNASPEIVKTIECNWSGNILSLGALNPGDTRSQSFMMTGESKFFGPIYVTWYNAKGESVSKNFNFRKENLPSIHDKTTYNYVQLYFDQLDMEVSTSDAPDLTGKIRRMEEVMNKYHDDFLKRDMKSTNMCANNNMNVCRNADSSELIAIGVRHLNAADFAPASY
jgi:hypothetical protein